MTARPMTEVEGMIAWRVVEEFETKPPTALEALVLARALLSTSAAVRGMITPQSAIDEVENAFLAAANKDFELMRDIRKRLRALSLIEGEDEQARPSGSAPISTDTKGTTK